MKLFLIAQNENDGYGTYDSAVVAAPDENTAKQIDPSTGGAMVWGKSYSSWCRSPEQVTISYLGDASSDIEQGVVCASFNSREMMSKEIMGWQPISTASKNRRHILLYEPHIMYVGWYDLDHSVWRINLPPKSLMHPLPTHWMPLPEAP